MEDISISKRHKRLLASLFFVLEQKIESIEHMLNHSQDNATYFIEQDLDPERREKLGISCVDLKTKIAEVSRILELKKRKISQTQYISTIQSQMWENISDAFSDKLKGYGKELVDSGKKADPLIREIADLIDQLRV